MTNTFFEHHIFYVAARISVEIPNARSIGTGFFYDALIQDGTNRSLRLLISNKHVFLNPRGRLTVSLNRQRDDGSPDLGNVIEFDQIGFEDHYFSHPDPQIDLACVNAYGTVQADAFYKFLNDDFLTPIDYGKVTPGNDVIFVGYPDNRYDVVNNLPLIRKGWIASMPDVDFNGKGQIVIDAQIFPGSSGSPVFVPWDGRYSLLGVVSQTMIRDSKLQVLQANTPQIGIKEILGLGIIIKQRHVQELIDFAVGEYIRRTSHGA
ncbi:MAG: serine protease [Candidatus Poribacteria bacterium]|nr:serine protease [Candidatus Poribacteria bacterium]